MNPASAPRTHDNAGETGPEQLSPPACSRSRPAGVAARVAPRSPPPGQGRRQAPVPRLVVAVGFARPPAAPVLLRSPLEPATQPEPVALAWGVPVPLWERQARGPAP